MGQLSLWHNMCWRIAFHLQPGHLSVDGSLIPAVWSAAPFLIGRMGIWGPRRNKSHTARCAHRAWVAQQLIVLITEGPLGTRSSSRLRTMWSSNRSPPARAPGEERVICLAKQVLEHFLVLGTHRTLAKDSLGSSSRKDYVSNKGG